MDGVSELYLAIEEGRWSGWERTGKGNLMRRLPGGGRLVVYRRRGRPSYGWLVAYPGGRVVYGGEYGGEEEAVAAAAKFIDARR